MTTKQIDYCIELAHTLNFSRAAENMFVSQPTLTYQIKLLEEEVGFPIFERSGKGAALTPAGAQFVSFLAGMREDLKRAIEQGQNFSATYRDSISISLMVRQAIYFLPEAIRLFAETNGDVQLTPVFQYENGVGSFLRNEVDILFALKEQTKQIPGIAVHELFESRVYLIADRDDPLAGKNIIREEDLEYHPGRGSLRTHPDGWRRFSSCAESGSASTDQFREDPIFQQSGSRYDPYECCRRERHMPCPRFSERPQRSICLDPL